MPKNVQFCLDAGANKAFNYKDGDWVEKIEAFVGKKSVDVVLDMVAGTYVQKNLSLMARDGRYALIAFLGGVKAEISRPLLPGSHHTFRFDVAPADGGGKSGHCSGLVCQCLAVVQRRAPSSPMSIQPFL